MCLYETRDRGVILERHTPVVVTWKSWMLRLTNQNQVFQKAVR